MKVYQVGITGHRPDRYKDAQAAEKLCRETIATIDYQYYDAGQLYFNLGGCIGADQWAGAACIDLDIDFNLFLPFPPNIQAQYWYDYQKEELERQVDHCSGLTIVGEEYKVANYFIRDRMIVDNSDFIICFWEGCLQGGTYQTIKYAVNNNKIVLNALDNLSLVSREQFRPKPKNYRRTK